MEINLCNSAGRDAVVAAASVGGKSKVRWLDPRGRQAASVRVLKAPRDRDADALVERFGSLNQLAQALIDGDPEIDLEMTGSFLRHTSRVYIDAERRIARKAQQWEVVRNPDGSERERRLRRLPEPNVGGETPLRWSGVFINREDAARRFVFTSKIQLIHVNGLTYDFLYGIAKELEERKSLMLLGAGPKSNQPLIVRRGGSPYRGFLDGRTQGDEYCLLLHFSNLELKTPAETSPQEAVS